VNGAGIEAVRYWFGMSDYRHTEIVNATGDAGSLFLNKEYEGRVEVQHLPVATAFGELRGHPETRRTLQAAMAEIDRLARASGVELPADVVAATLAFVDQQPTGGTTSLQRDIAAGRPSELDAWTGSVVRLGRETGIPTPVNDVLYAVLRLREGR